MKKLIVVEDKNGLFVKADNGSGQWQVSELDADQFLFGSNIVIIETDHGWDAFFWKQDLDESGDSLLFTSNMSEEEVIEAVVNYWQKNSFLEPKIYILLQSK